MKNVGKPAVFDTGGRTTPMHFNPLSLAFRGPDKALEPRFIDDYLTLSISHMRIAICLGIVLYAVFGILDALLLPEHKHLTWMIRYGAVCPLMVAVFFFSYHKRFKPLSQPLLAAMVILGGGGIIAMIVIAPPPVNYSYYAGLILTFIFGYTFARLRFLWATLAGWILVVMYEIAAVWLSDTPFAILINNNFFFISSNIIGMLACYAIEYFARRDFFLVTLLAEEREKVRTANIELENRVAERTRQLQAINVALEKEVAERLRVEKEQAGLQSQLKQAEKMEAIGNLASGVAHDLNNILSGLVGYPELLLMELPQDSPLLETVQIIHQSGLKAAEMVQDLLTLSRRGAAVEEVLSLNAVIEEYLASPEGRHLMAGQTKVQVQTAYAEDLLNIKGSRVHLSKTLMNLVANAADALIAPGTITIGTINCYLDQSYAGYETVAAGEYVKLSVADTGVGIAAGDLKKIFEPFFTKKKMGRSGTGLGMTVVWSTVKDHRGFIDVQSAEGVGTTFDLYFPVTRQTATETDQRFTIDDYCGSETVLVVDDFEQQRNIASGMLSKLGYQVDSVACGEEAVAYLKNHPVDILVLDMIMAPGIDGCETYKRIAARRPGQRAIIASGYSESERVKEVQRLGAGAYIKKPYTLEKIGLAVRAELDR